jgi:glutamate/tyrosine decarboxylase-like PLP-dependent enzyme
VIVSDRLRLLLAGIETADSVTIDAHKWLATTMGCGMFLTPHGGVLNDAFHVSASTAPFMPSNTRHLDPYVTTAQWSRRFLGLRLFLALAAAGWDGYAAHVERAVDLIATLKAELAARGWTVINQSEMAVLCVTPPAGFLPAAEIARAVVATRQGWVASTRFQGRDVVRICVTNGETSTSDMHALADLLHRTGAIPAA